MKKPFISVVVPTRNRSTLLANTLRSVLAQQRVELEVIVVDGSSTDDTLAVLSRCGDARVRVLRQPLPLGVSSARNCGAADARGEWLGFVDDDDLWSPDKLAQQVYAAQTVGREWAYTGSVNIADGGRIVSGRPPLGPDDVVAAVRRCNVIPGGGSNVVVRRAMWDLVGPFNTQFRGCEDWEMWIRLAKHGPPACVSRPLLAYRVHTTNASLDVIEVIRGAKLIESLHRTTVDWGLLHRWMAESCLRKGRRTAAVRHLMAAAARGHLRGVASDAAAIVRRRVARHRGSGDAKITADSNAWIAEATQWLTEFTGRDDEESVATTGRSRDPQS